MGRPFFDKIAGKYVIKIKGNKGWQKVPLFKPDTPPDDPLDIPAHVLELAVKHRQGEQHTVQGLNAQPLVPIKLIDLDKRLTRYVNAQCRTLRPNSQEKLIYIIGRFRPYCQENGIRWLHEVRAATVKDFAEASFANCQEQTTKAYLSLLGHLFSEAIDMEEYQGRNPVRAVCQHLRGTDTTDSPKFFSEAERAEFLAEIRRRIDRPLGARGKLPQWVEDIVLVMLNTGMRVNAAIHAEFSWFDPTGHGKTNVPKDWSKSGKRYSTLFNPAVRAIVERRRLELGPDAIRVFPEINGGAWLYYRLKYVVKGLVKSGKFSADKGHYNHILRHTFITEALKVGVPLVHVSKMAGHTTVACTQRYDHTTFDDAIAAGVEKSFALC